MLGATPPAGDVAAWFGIAGNESLFDRVADVREDDGDRPCGVLHGLHVLRPPTTKTSTGRFTSESTAAGMSSKWPSTSRCSITKLCPSRCPRTAKPSLRLSTAWRLAASSPILCTFPSTALGRRAARRATRWSQPRTRVARSCGVPSRRASPCAPRYCQPRRAPAGGLTITIDRGQFLPDLAPPFYGLKFPVSGVGARSPAWFCRSCGPSVGAAEVDQPRVTVRHHSIT